MLSFITFKDAPEQIEITADSQGIEELIEYLKWVKTNKDHLHLLIGSELDEYPIPKDKEGAVFNAKYVTLRFEE